MEGDFIMDIQFDYIGEINDNGLLTMQNHIKLQKGQITNLTINISSPGGAVTPGIAMYNYLKKQDFNIITHNFGEVSSAAILLYLAGNIRTASAISKFMFHPIKADCNGALSYYQIEELLKNIEADITNYSKIVNVETDSLHRKYKIDEYLRTQILTLSKDSAFECGVVTKID